MVSTDFIAKYLHSPVFEPGREPIRLDYSNVKTLDILPASADITLGKEFQFLDFDNDTVLARLREEGLTDQQIANYRFIFSAETPAYNGIHYAAERTISLFPLTLLSGIHNDAQSIFDSDASLSTFEYHGSFVALSKMLSETAYHEIRHARQHCIDTHKLDEKVAYHVECSKAYKRRFILGAAASLLAGGTVELFAKKSGAVRHIGAAGIALAGIIATGQTVGGMIRKNKYRDYADNPVELDAREAGAEAPEFAVIALPRVSVLLFER